MDVVDQTSSGGGGSDHSRGSNNNNNNPHQHLYLHDAMVMTGTNSTLSTTASPTYNTDPSSFSILHPTPLPRAGTTSIDEDAVTPQLKLPPRQLMMARNPLPSLHPAANPTLSSSPRLFSILKDPLLPPSQHHDQSPHQQHIHNNNKEKNVHHHSMYYATMVDPHDDEIGKRDEKSTFSVLHRLFFHNRTMRWLRSPPTALSIYLVLFAVMAGGMIYGVSRELYSAGNGHYFFLFLFGRDNEANIDWDVYHNVAFLGNSYFFVNDIPRALESMSGGHVYQNSCLHPGSSLAELWITGNGMVKLWSTPEAQLSTESYGTLYDYGLCSVAHILQGHDEYMAYGNEAGKYYDDGLNPCLHDETYDTFIRASGEIQVAQWDYVVLVDQTKRMAIPQARNETVQVLQNGYAKFLTATTTTSDGSSQAQPTVILVDTHAFWSDSTNMTGLDSDIVGLTRLIYQGVQVYASALSKVLAKPPLVAPIGLCFLVIYEEDYDLWRALFLDDQIHMSLIGSYLFTMVLYTTIFGHLPPSDLYIPSVFADARKIIGGGGGRNGGNNNNNAALYESLADLDPYFRQVVRKVVLKRYRPSSLDER
jgi:hypothetical protein